MLVFLAAPARFRRSTDSTFKAEPMIDAKKKPILEESPVHPPSQGVALKFMSGRDKNAWVVCA